MRRGSNVFVDTDVRESSGSSYPEAYQHVTKDRYVRRLTDAAGL